MQSRELIPIGVESDMAERRRRFIEQRLATPALAGIEIDV